MKGVTYEDMRPGSYEVKPRLDDMDANHIEAALCFPTFPRFCGQTFTEAEDKELGLLCVKAYNDWMVEEWCGDSGGRLIPLCLIPLWDVELAAAEVRRNADARRPRRLLQRDPALPRACRACTTPTTTGTPSSGPAPRRRRSSTCTSAVVVEDAVDLGRRTRRRSGRRSRTPTPPSRWSTSSSAASSCASPTSRSPTRRARSAGSPTSWSGPTRCGRRTAAGAGWPTSCRRSRRATSRTTCGAASSTTPTG